MQDLIILLDGTLITASIILLAIIFERIFNEE